MIVTEIRKSIIFFCKRCDKVTLWFGILMMCRFVGFVYIPQPIIYTTLILFTAYSLLKNKYKSYNTSFLIFLVYIPIQLLIVRPDPLFRSWERYALFVLLIVCVSPLLLSRAHAERRMQIFQIAMVFCAFLGVGSFFAKFLGINYMYRHIEHYFGCGTFGGLTMHSMVLGPIAGIGTIYCCYKSFEGNKKTYWVLTLFCVASVMFSASRSALMATICGLTIALYRIMGSASKYIKALICIIILSCVSFPMWGSALDAVIEKNEKNIGSGGAFSSRDSKWESRIEEFRTHPFLGTGFDALDINISGYHDVDRTTGTIESGSSWLIILSMTGIIGGAIMIPILFNSFLRVYWCRTKHGGLICGVYAMFLVHMIAEGYIYYGGSPLAFLVWLTIGVAYDSGTKYN